MEDSETKTTALEKVADLEDELTAAHERIATLEYDVLSRQTEMEQHLSVIKMERDELFEQKYAFYSLSCSPWQSWKY